MDCSEARHLLARGVTPSSASAERAKLGFHLSGCASCRSFHASLGDPLLQALLASTSPTAASRTVAAARDVAHAAAPPVAATPPTPPARRALPNLSTGFWYFGVGMLTVLGLVVLGAGGVIALSLFNIRTNIQAMYVPVPASSAPAVVALPPATATATTTAPPAPTATATATPSATATFAPTATLAPTATPAPPTPGPVTVLLLGSDLRPGESGPSRTDTVMVVRFDPQQKRVALLSLPRDLWVDIPGYGASRINAANAWGTMYNAPGGGPGLAVATVSTLLGIPIDYYVYTDFSGFIGAIDAIGGVTVQVEKALYDPHFPTMDYGYTVASFAPGPQQMDGATALMYSRIRHPDSDFARIRRQQAVIIGVLDQLHSANLFSDLKHLEATTAALRPYVQTDMPADNVLGLMWALRHVQPEAVEQYSLGADMVSFGVGNDQWAEVAVPGVIEQLAQQLLGQNRAQ